MEPTKNKYWKTDVTKDGREVYNPKAYDGKDFLEEWVRENVDEVKEVRANERRAENKAKREKRKAETEVQSKPRSSKASNKKKGNAKEKSDRLQTNA